MSSNTLQSAIASIRSGDKEAGKLLLAEVIRDDPRNETAWLWMSSTIDSDDHRRFCLERVLTINPHNETARRGLEVLSHKQTQEPPPFGKPPETTPLPSVPAPTDALPQITRLEQELIKKCPYCAEAIKAEAVVCRFCGRDLRIGQPAQVVIEQPPSEKKVSQGEVTYYQAKGVRVTNTRAILRAKTYAMANITSVLAAKESANRLAGIVIALIGLMISMCVLGLVLSGGADTGAIAVLVFGIVLLVVGILLAVLPKDKYIVRLGSASGEVDALISTDKEYILSIVNALNEAIIKRG